MTAATLLGLALAASSPAPPPAPTPALSAPSAEVVLEQVNVNIDSRLTATEIGSRTVHILSPAGLQHAAQVLVVPPFTEINDVEGALVSASGKRSEIKPKDVEERPLLESASLATDAKLLVVPFAQAAVGDTVTIRWRRTMSSLLYLEDWEFRGELPIKRSVYKLTVPQGFDLRWHAWNGEPAPSVSDEANGRTYTFETTDAAPLEEEPWAPPRESRRGVVSFAPARLSFGAVTSPIDDWSGVADFYDQLSDGRYGLDPEMSREWAAKARSDRDVHATIARAYAELESFRYLQLYLGAGGLQPHVAKWIWQRHYGDCKDLTTVFVALLRASGVTAYPMLTHAGPGESFVAGFATPRQFNHCVAYLPLKQGAMIVDPTNPWRALGSVSEALAGAPGLVVLGRHRHELLTLPAAAPVSDRVDAELSLAASAEGGWTGTAEIKFAGDAYARARRLLAEAKSAFSWPEIDALLPGSDPNMSLSEITSEPIGEELHVHAKLRLAGSLPTDHSTRIVAPAVFVSEPRVGAFAAETRTQAVDLGGLSESHYSIAVHTGAAARCPEPVKVEGPWGSYAVSCETRADAVVLDRKLRVDRATVEPRDYQEARAFWLGVARGDRTAAAFEGAQ